MTLGIWNCFWSHKNYFWRREDAYDIDYTNIHSRAHSSLNWDMLFSINISLFAMHILHGTQIHHCWHHRNSILKRRVIVEWEHLVQQFYDSPDTVIFNLFISILEWIRKQLINLQKQNVLQIITYNTNNIEYFYEVFHWFLLAWFRFFKTNFSDLSLSKLIRQLSYRMFIDRKQ